MGRVSIIGNAAGGKSTLCKKLKVAKNLPLFAVDTLQWKLGWIPVPREEVESGIKEIISRDKWIIDGWGPWETIEVRDSGVGPNQTAVNMGNRLNFAP